MTTTPTIWKAKFTPNFQSTAGEQTSPQSIGLANGNILTVWEDSTGGSSPGYDIMGQMFDPYGNSTGPLFQVNAAIVNQDETWPEIKALPDGGYVVAYDSYDSSLGDYIVVQRFDSSGVAVSNGLHFITDVDLGSIYGGVIDVRVKDITVDDNGNYIVAFQRGVEYIEHGTFGGEEHILSSDVHAIVYNYISNNPGPERSVAQNTVDDDTLDAIATFNDGNVITVSTEPDDDQEGVEYMIWQSGTGSVVVPPVAVAGGGDHAAFGEDVAVLTGGQFVIVYRNGESLDTVMRIGASDAPGAALSPEIKITDGDLGARVVALNDGGFMVAWEAGGVVHGTRYTADGTVVGTSGFEIATGAAGDEQFGDLSLTSDGRVLVTWRGADGEIAEAIVDPRENTINGTDNGEVLTTQVGDSVVFANGGDDTVYGLGGDDVIYGGLGADTLRGGAGDDTYILHDVNQTDPNLNLWFYDTVIEAANQGIDTIQIEYVANAKTTYVLPANVENGVVVDVAAFNLTGNGLDNRLTGNGAANTLSGLGGNDTLRGGGNNDTINGGAGFDTAVVSGHGNAYTIGHSGATVTVSGPDGSDTLTGVEKLQFDDGYLQLLDWSFSYLRSDFGNDGRSDILWRQDSGLISLWQMNGAQVLHANSIASVGPDWHIAGAGDFTGDGKSDILWRQDGGLVALWQMNGAQVLHADGIASVGPDWHIAGVGDFNGDGMSDILWRQDGGLVALWQMNGTQVLHSDGIASIGPDWHIAGVGDFNGDGKNDILWRQDGGLVALWQMNGAQVLRADGIASVGPDWHISGIGDFDGDGKSDILWRQDGGLVALWQMNGAQAHGDGIASVGFDWHIAGVSDVNGDGKSDILWRQDGGLVALWQMNGAQAHGDGIANIGPDRQIAATHFDLI